MSQSCLYQNKHVCDANTHPVIFLPLFVGQQEGKSSQRSAPSLTPCHAGHLGLCDWPLKALRLSGEGEGWEGAATVSLQSWSLCVLIS